MLTPGGLFDVLDEAITDAAPTRRRFRWRSRHRTVVWLTAHTVQIGDHVWWSQHHGDGRYGYSLVQAQQMRDALLPILAQYTRPVERAVRRFHPTPPILMEDHA